MGERTYGGMTWEEIKGHALPLDMPHDDLWELMRLLCQGAFCSYCGEEFLYDDHIKSFLVMQEHIKTCPKHPLSAALARIEALEAETAKLRAVAEAVAPAFRRALAGNRMVGLLTHEVEIGYHALLDAGILKEENNIKPWDIEGDNLDD